MKDEPAPPFWPKFGLEQFTPARCREPSPGLTGKEAKADRRRCKKAALGPCPLCGSTRGSSTIEEHSWAICPGCFATAPGKARLAATHARPSLKYDRRKPAPKAEPKPWVSPWLTKREAKGLAAEAAESGDPALAAAVGGFLASRPAS